MTWAAIAILSALSPSLSPSILLDILILSLFFISCSLLPTILLKLTQKARIKGLVPVSVDRGVSLLRTFFVTAVHNTTVLT